LESNSENHLTINNTEIPVNPLLSNNEEQSSSYLMDKEKSRNMSSGGDGVINVGFNMNSNLTSNNPLLSSNINSINFNRYNEFNNSITNDGNSIVMKKLGTGSLKLELETLKDLSLINSEIINIPNRRKNILATSFKKNNKKYKIKTQPNKNNFNDFNKKIMITAGWGNDTHDNMNEFKEKNNVVYSRHITKQQVLRELGSNILSGIKVRLPRERKVDINNNIQ
jgi:hypothetical protein